MGIHAQELSFQAADKEAVLMVHFGTTYDETRQKTIDVINERVRSEFPQAEVREAFTSPRVVKQLAKRGIRKDNTIEALMRLRADGYRRVTVQPTYVIDGKETALMRHDVEQLRPFFDTLRVGTPLLYSVKDTRHVSDALTARHPADKKKREHVLFVGHGTAGPATALYSQMDYLLSDTGNDNYHVATIEGYPTLDGAISRLKAQKAKQVTLVPLLFVAGDHATNDIAVDWKAELEKQGLKVILNIEGLGEVPAIQAIYVERIKALLNEQTSTDRKP